MNGNDQNRPRVTKVKVTVKSSIEGGALNCTEILLFVDREVNSSNFNYFPKIKHLSTVYQTRGDRDFFNDPINGIHTVKFRENEIIFHMEIGVDVENDGLFKFVEFVHDLEIGGCD